MTLPAQIRSLVLAAIQKLDKGPDSRRTFIMTTDAARMLTNCLVASGASVDEAFKVAETILCKAYDECDDGHRIWRRSWVTSNLCQILSWADGIHTLRDLRNSCGLDYRPER